MSREVTEVCGYNPQLLLTDRRSTATLASLWSKDVLDEMMGMSYAQMTSMMSAKEISDEFIDFAPLYRTETVIYAQEDGTAVEIGTGRLYYEHVNNTRHSVPRWGEADTDPLADIQDLYERMTGEYRIHCHVEMSEAELTHLFAALRHDSQPLVLDLDSRGGDIPGSLNELIYRKPHYNDVVSGLAPRRKPAPDYHKHDKTKNHRRPRRGR